MGKKYVIELCDKPMKNENGGDIWRVKGFNTLVFDQNGLDKLEEYKEYKESHVFKVGDVCKDALTGSNFIITRMTPDYISYMFIDGSHGTCLRSIFEHEMSFVRHSDEFYSFIKGGLK